MHAKFMLLGSTTAINAVIAAAVQNGATIASVELSVSDGDSLDRLTLTGNAASTPTGTGTAAPTPIPSVPSAVAPTPTALPPVTMPPAITGEEDDEGDATDGSGVDSAGLPWDERIHSSSKKRGKDGTWNKRRGGPSGAELAAIENELRAKLTGAPPPQPVAVPAPVAPPAPMPVVPPMPTAVPEAPVPMPTAVPEAPVPMPTAAPVELDFPTFMQQIGPRLGEGEGQIGAAYLSTVCQSLGLNTMTDLALKPELIASFVAILQQGGRW